MYNSLFPQVACFSYGVYTGQTQITYSCRFLCLGVHVPKHMVLFVYLCVYLYVCNSHFSKVAKNQALVNAVQPQRDNISNVIVLDFWSKALFSSYGEICSPLTLLWHVPYFPDDQSAHSESPCILILESIQQLQLLTAKLHSKHAILVNWI